MFRWFRFMIVRRAFLVLLLICLGCSAQSPPSSPAAVSPPSDTVFLAAPTSTERRLRLVAQYSTGFVYLVSRTGVTGARESVSDAVGPLVDAVRAVTDLPLAVGFGISRPEHVTEL